MSESAEARARKFRGVAAKLFDFGFFEVDVLARDRIVLLERELLGRRARVLLRHIKKAGSSGADQLDLLSCGLGHLDLFSNRCVMRFSGNLATRDPKSSLASHAAVAAAHHVDDPISVV
jgi:hypothetical protein